MKGSSNRGGEPRPPKVVSFNVEGDDIDTENRPKNDKFKFANARESKVQVDAIRLLAKSAIKESTPELVTEDQVESSFRIKPDSEDIIVVN